MCVKFKSRSNVKIIFWYNVTNQLSNTTKWFLETVSYLNISPRIDCHVRFRQSALLYLFTSEFVEGIPIVERISSSNRFTFSKEGHVVVVYLQNNEEESRNRCTRAAITTVRNCTCRMRLSPRQLSHYSVADSTHWFLRFLLSQLPTLITKNLKPK